jgi:hypothetical protein
MARVDEVRDQLFRRKWGTSAELRLFLANRLKELKKKKKLTDMEKGELDRIETILINNTGAGFILDVQFGTPGD